jgi:hypothetical protein
MFPGEGSEGRREGAPSKGGAVERLPTRWPAPFSATLEDVSSADLHRARLRRGLALARLARPIATFSDNATDQAMQLPLALLALTLAAAGLAEGAEPVMAVDSASVRPRARLQVMPALAGWSEPVDLTSGHAALPPSLSASLRATLHALSLLRGEDLGSFRTASRASPAGPCLRESSLTTARAARDGRSGAGSLTRRLTRPGISRSRSTTARDAAVAVP